MDIATGIGLIAGIGTVVSIILIDGGNFAAYFDKHAVIIIFGGAMAATMVRFPFSVIVHGLPMGLRYAFTLRSSNPHELIGEITQIAEVVRKSGPMAIENVQVAEDVLTAHSDLTGLFASNESSTVGAMRAVRQRNLAGKVTLVGFDATADLVQNVREGAIDSLVVQDPFKMGYEGVKTIVDKIGGKQPERRIDTGVALLTKENVDTPAIQKLIK